MALESFLKCRCLSLQQWSSNIHCRYHVARAEGESGWENWGSESSGGMITTLFGRSQEKKVKSLRIRSHSYDLERSTGRGDPWHICLYTTEQTIRADDCSQGFTDERNVRQVYYIYMTDGVLENGYVLPRILTEQSRHPWSLCTRRKYGVAWKQSSQCLRTVNALRSLIL